jgi:hypothetical protein
VLVRPVTETIGKVAAVWDELGAGWAEIFADYNDAELALLARHMRRTTALSRAQVQRLRA